MLCRLNKKENEKIWLEMVVIIEFSNHFEIKLNREKLLKSNIFSGIAADEFTTNYNYFEILCKQGLASAWNSLKKPKISIIVDNLLGNFELDVEKKNIEGVEFACRCCIFKFFEVDEPEKSYLTNWIVQAVEI